MNDYMKPAPKSEVLDEVETIVDLMAAAKAALKQHGMTVTDGQVLTLVGRAMQRANVSQDGEE